MKVKYKNHVFKGNPEIVKKEIDEIIAFSGDATPEQIVEKAKDETTELHKCFTWNNDEAAEQWRLHEARQLVLNIVVVNEESEDKREPVRCYFKTDYDTGYKPTEIIVRRADEYQKLLANALKELQTFEKKYKTISELAELFEIIERLVA